MSVFKNFSIRKSHIVGILVLALLLTGGIIVNAQNNIDPQTSSRIKEKLSTITNNEFGEITLKKSVDFNQKKYIIAEDNNYTYRVNADTGDIATIIAINYNDMVNVTDNALNGKIKPIADRYLQKYCHRSNDCKYDLAEYNYKDDYNEKHYDFTYYESASNGVKTGWGVYIAINNAGDLVALATHEGDATVAQETKPKLSRNDAAKIGIDSIKTEQIFNEIEDFPEDKSELTVWENKLAWSVKIDPIKAGGFIYGFDFKIDAVTGEILFKDNYAYPETN